MAVWHVYLLRCGDGSLYCGVTTDLERRVAEHAQGRGARYTRGRGPVSLAGWGAFPDKSRAYKVEAAVKKRPAAQKLVFLAAQAELHGIPSPD